jgi:ABC-type nitrate/sulfonate/bicarbonate transport system substrate-binding protein
MKLGRLLAAAVCALALAAPAWAADKVTIGLIGSPGSGGWLYYIGIDEGYFVAAGIEPELVYVPTAPGLMQQLIAGSLDVVGGDGVVEPIHALAKGARVAILRMISGITPYEMLAKPGIKSVQDLKGKTICIGGLMDINRIYLERIMRSSGLKDGDYDLVIIGNTAQRYAALLSGTVDATMLVPPSSFFAEKAGFSRLGMIMDYAGDLPMASADVTVAWAGAHPGTAKKLIRVLDRSVAWFYEDKNRDAAIDVLVKEAHADRGQVAETYDFVRKIGMYEKGSGVSRAGLEHLIAAMRSIGDLQGVSVTPDELVVPNLTPLTP